jgi:hypothetical protein
MFELTDLNAEMAACWKVSWNVEPLPLRVPLAELVPPVPVVPAAVVPLAAGAEVVDEEQAARASAAMTAPPAITAVLLPLSCMWVISRDRR